MKDQELIIKVSEKLDSIPQQFEKVIRNQIKNVLYPQLNNTMLPIIEEKTKVIFQESVLPKIDLTIQSNMSKINKSEDIQQALGETFKSYFTDTLAPAFSQSCQNLFFQMNQNWQKGLEEYKKTTIENITNDTVIKSFLSTTEKLNERFLDSQNKLLNQHYHLMKKFIQPSETDNDIVSETDKTSETKKLSNTTDIKKKN